MGYDIKKRSFQILSLLFLCVSVGWSTGCQSNDSSTGGPHLSEDEKLIKQHCGSCHVSAEPAHLDKQTWRDNVLPAMAPKLGIKVYRKKQYYPDPNGSAISMEEWTRIVEYFQENAPEQLEIPDPPEQKSEASSLFSVRKPQWADSLHNIATTTMVTFNPLNKQIYTSDATRNRLYRWDENLEPTTVKKLRIPGVHASFVEDSTGVQHGIFTSIGTMRAVDVANGRLWDLNLRNDSVRIIGEDLPRPVHSVHGDFNKDGRRDWVVCGFGHEKGGLYLLEQQENYQFEKKTIRPIAGAIDAETGDFDGDGWLDLMVLFAHGDEGIWLFLNDKEGGFESKNLLRFPPVYGSTSFQLEDFNGNGQPDILYTAGDNADYSQILKPYHGIYIFINRGDFTFEQEYFYHLNGATEAVATDFDGDGDPDIAAHGFFADLKHNPLESFVYLEQKDSLSFTLHHPDIDHLGRWLTMDVGDFEGDGDPDIVLGNYSRQFIHQDSLQKDWDTHLPFILLSNTIN